MRCWIVLWMVCLSLAGCAPAPAEKETMSARPAAESTTVVNSSPASESATAPATEPEQEPLPEMPLITFGGGTTAAPASTTTTPAATSQTGESIIARLKDLQILLGTWRGITQKVYDGFKAVDETAWVWDFKTDRQQPALVMTSEKSPYYREARLTYLPASSQYQLTLTSPEGEKRVLQGTFSEPIADDPGDDGKPQRTYKLELTEIHSPADETERLVLNQQNNNRYLLELYRQRGNNDRFLRVDTVSTQREGTSLAMIEEGYGEKTCIISAGLGTMTVSHAGQTYYVCCTGCKAAFEDDPERWIARAKEAAAKK